MQKLNELTFEFDNRPVRELTLDETLENRAQELADRPFLIYGHEDRTLTYSEVNDTANRIGNGLLDLGIERGDHVAPMFQDSLRSALMVFGCAKIGAVYAPINFEYKGNALSYQIDDIGPDLLLVEDAFIDRLNAVTDEIESRPRTVVHETDGEAEPLDEVFERHSFDDLLASRNETPPVDVHWNDTAWIIYTSGTTGDPKGVMLPHRWVLFNHNSMSARMLDPDDVIHNWMPLHHVGGASADMCSGLLAGATVVMWDRFSRSNFWDRVERYGVTRVTLVSSVINWLMNEPEDQDDYRNTINKAHLQPLPTNYREIAERFGFDIVGAAFGQTESGIPISGTIHAVQGERATPSELQRGTSAAEVVERLRAMNSPVVEDVPGDGYLGKPRNELFEVTVLDTHDEQLPPGEAGHLAVRSKFPGTLFQEYYEKPEKTVEDTRNLWFHTGDAAYYDADGNFYYVDRVGDFIRRRGENISSQQVEDILNTHPSIDNVAVFAVPSDEGDEDEVAAAIELVGEAQLEENQLRAFAGERMADFMVPRFVWFVDELPTTQTNKIQKSKLREELFEGY